MFIAHPASFTSRTSAPDLKRAQLCLVHRQTAAPIFPDTSPQKSRQTRSTDPPSPAASASHFPIHPAAAYKSPAADAARDCGTCNDTQPSPASATKAPQDQPSAPSSKIPPAHTTSPPAPTPPPPTSHHPSTAPDNVPATSHSTTPTALLPPCSFQTPRSCAAPASAPRDENHC